MFLRQFIVLFVLIIANVSFAEQFNGKVSKVIDGDTIWVRSDSTTIKVRLSYIDAPELKQIFGIQSKKYLTSLVLDKNVEIHSYKWW